MEAFYKPTLSAFSECVGLMEYDDMTGRCTRTGINASIGTGWKDEGLGHRSGI